MKVLAAQVFLILSIVIVLFQAGLALGMPWGAASMGGRYPGKYPQKMRWVALLNIFILFFLSAVVLAKSGLYFLLLGPISDFTIWFCVVFFGLATVLNSITPSKVERVWAPVALVQFICCLVLALKE